VIDQGVMWHPKACGALLKELAKEQQESAASSTTQRTHEKQYDSPKYNMPGLSKNYICWLDVECYFHHHGVSCLTRS